MLYQKGDHLFKDISKGRLFVKGFIKILWKKGDSC